MLSIFTRHPIPFIVHLSPLPSSLPQDAARVIDRFDRAASLGAEVEVRSVGAEEILRHIAHSGPVIVLTDARFLRCDLCRANQAGAELSSCFPCASEYRGEFIARTRHRASRRRCVRAE